MGDAVQDRIKQFHAGRESEASAESARTGNREWVKLDNRRGRVAAGAIVRANAGANVQQGCSRSKELPCDREHVDVAQCVRGCGEGVRNTWIVPRFGAGAVQGGVPACPGDQARWRVELAHSGGRSFARDGSPHRPPCGHRGAVVEDGRIRVGCPRAGMV